jgi:hypothetical protein
METNSKTIESLKATKQTLKLISQLTGNIVRDLETSIQSHEIITNKATGIIKKAESI